MADFRINRSGRTIKISLTNEQSDYIGTIQPNQVYVWTGTHLGSEAVFFLDQSTASWKTGWLSGSVVTGEMTPLTQCSLYNLDTGMGNGVESIFSTRSAVNMYNTAGTYIKTLPKNTFITTKNARAGDSNRKLMLISSYGADGGDPIPVNAFIDISVATMMFNAFPLVGTLR